MRKFLSTYINRRDLRAIAAVILLGSVCHFFYQWSGGSALAALFCPVSESPWEHLKLLFFPFLFLSIWSFFRHPRNGCRFFFCRFWGVICGLCLILVLFYTYTGILGRHFLMLDLLIFCLSVFLSFAVSRYFCRSLVFVPSVNVIFTLWLSVTLCFFLFTCFPPNIPLFFPPA